MINYSEFCDMVSSLGKGDGGDEMFEVMKQLEQMKTVDEVKENAEFMKAFDSLGKDKQIVLMMLYLKEICDNGTIKKPEINNIYIFLSGIAENE